MPAAASPTSGCRTTGAPTSRSIEGRNNFDTLRYEYYRDPNVALEAFKAGQFDLRVENQLALLGHRLRPARRSTKGLITKLEIPTEGGNGMQGFVFNMRRAMFPDPRVRQALGYAFDFEWTNKNLFYGQYTRTDSYFSNSELAAHGLPGPDELALLEPFRDQLPQEVFDQDFKPPVTDGSGNNRDNLRAGRGPVARRPAGRSSGGKLVNTATGEPLAFEILLDSGGLFERIVGAVRPEAWSGWASTATVRTVDDAQYQNRAGRLRLRHDRRQSSASALSPGNEQRDFWGSAAADQPGSRNTIGIKDPVVDALIDKIITRPRPRGADRRLPGAGSGAALELLRDPALAQPADPDRLLGQVRPPGDVWPRYGVDLFAWWIDPARPRRTIDAGASRAWAQPAELSSRRCSPTSSAGCCSSCPTLFGIMLVNFVIVQAAPGGPVQQVIAELPAAASAPRRGSPAAAATRRRPAPAATGPGRPSAAIAARSGLDPAFIKDLERQYGFDKPAWQRFVDHGLELPALRFRRELLPQPLGAGAGRRQDAGLDLAGLWTTLLTYLIVDPARHQQGGARRHAVRRLDQQRDHRRLRRSRPSCSPCC